MSRRSLLSLVLALTICSSITGQDPKLTPKATPTSPPIQEPAVPGEDDVVRITANLVQVDAVVTDKNGTHITDLTDQDFEVLEDGRTQKISNLSYVAVAPMSTDNAAEAAPETKNKADRRTSMPPVQIKAEQVHRTIALVVDDLGLSFESTVYVRAALKKFVDEQIQPGDLAAIIRTSAGTGALQQFTADKRLLYAAIERVRWYPMGRGKVSTFDPIDLDPLTRLHTRAAQSIPGAIPTFGENSGADIEQFRQDVFSVGTLGALKFVVQGMTKLPGRKSVVMVSDGISIFNRVRNETSNGENGSSADARHSRDPQVNGVLEMLRRITDFANRASVVIYTMDARGLQTVGFTAADNTGDLSTQDVAGRLVDRRTEFYNSQDGLNYLAQQTGGFFIHDSNDLAAGIKKVLDDQGGYYLIGYRPDDSTFDASGHRTFHHLTIKVKRPGLKVRARTGFFGITDEEIRATTHTDEQKLLEALISPFSSPDIHLRLTSLFGSESQKGTVMRALMHIEGADLSFTDSPNGWHQLSFEVLAVTFTDGGAVADKYRREETMRVREDAYRQAMKDGLVYTLNVPIKKAGAYQLRVAVRDAVSKRIGSASEFVEVPDLKKGRLALSGIVLAGLDAESTASNQTSSAISGAGAAAQAIDPQATPAVRRLRPGMLLTYAYLIYNARLDKLTHQPRLQTQIRLFRDDKLIYTGKVLPVDAKGQTDMTKLATAGTMQIGSSEMPGAYFLELRVSDLLADNKYSTSIGWIDFELVP
jgi:VWFA-related protein